MGMLKLDKMAIFRKENYFDVNKDGQFIFLSACKIISGPELKIWKLGFKKIQDMKRQSYCLE